LQKQRLLPTDLLLNLTLSLLCHARDHSTLMIYGIDWATSLFDLGFGVFR